MNDKKRDYYYGLPYYVIIWVTLQHILTIGLILIAEENVRMARSSNVGVSCCGNGQYLAYPTSYEAVPSCGNHTAVSYERDNILYVIYGRTRSTAGIYRISESDEPARGYRKRVNVRVHPLNHRYIWLLAAFPVGAIYLGCIMIPIIFMECVVNKFDYRAMKYNTMHMVIQYIIAIVASVFILVLITYAIAPNDVVPSAARTVCCDRGILRAQFADLSCGKLISTEERLTSNGTELIRRKSGHAEQIGDYYKITRNISHLSGYSRVITETPTAVPRGNTMYVAFGFSICILILIQWIIPCILYKTKNCFNDLYLI